MELNEIVDSIGVAARELEVDFPAVKESLKSDRFTIQKKGEEVWICSVLTRLQQKLESIDLQQLPHDFLVLPFSLGLLKPSYDFDAHNSDTEMGDAINQIDALLSSPEGLSLYREMLKVTKYFENICYRHIDGNISKLVDTQGIEPCSDCEAMAAAEPELSPYLLKVKYYNATLPLFLWVYRRTKSATEAPLIQATYEFELNADSELIKKREKRVKSALMKISDITGSDTVIGLMSLCDMISRILESVQSIDELAKQRIGSAEEPEVIDRSCQVVEECNLLKALIYSQCQRIFMLCLP